MFLLGDEFYQFQEAIERYHVALCVPSSARRHSAACYRSVLYVSVVSWTYITLNAKACILTPKKDCIELNRLLVVPNATRWSSVFDAVTNLLSICSANKDGLQSACQKLDI